MLLMPFVIMGYILLDKNCGDVYSDFEDNVIGLYDLKTNVGDI